jgi:hypothetical protein
MAPLLESRQTTEHYVDETDLVLLDDTLGGVIGRGLPVDQLPGLEPCGPRRKIFFDPSKTRAAIVTCGGLCPGLNDVIAGLVRNLTYHYKVRRVIGIQNGYQRNRRSARAKGAPARAQVRPGRPVVALDPGVLGVRGDRRGQAAARPRVGMPLRGRARPGRQCRTQHPRRRTGGEQRNARGAGVSRDPGPATGRQTRTHREHGMSRADRNPHPSGPGGRQIDPSYPIRSVPANPYDSVYCVRLSQAAVHAAMSGRTEMVVGRWRRRFVHLPMALAVSRRNQVDPRGDLWMAVLESTGQPVRFT